MLIRLKSLELHGYKTFANRTLFEFADAITAIVGPNGSGKSNIADSLRWVLGEQSFSLLRGKKTEDMIFSGSETRPRAGMASATITFDNSDGWLPIDFAEVAITRRAYRDGQNEYLINRQRVRLKDVSELLAQSGLAERTYTIIGQGLVDAALSLKAEERRRLFEEAAGVGLHRARREDALRRLDLTQRNLERVQDILAELEPRLASLERQARRAQEFNQVKADLQLALRDWYGYHWHRSQQELMDAQLATRIQEEALSKVRQELEELDRKLTAVGDHLLGLRAQLNAWHHQSALLHTRREELNRELAVAEERIRSQTAQAQTAQDEQARLAEEQNLYQQQIKETELELERLKVELNEARAQSEQTQQALDERLKERSQHENSLQDVRESLNSLGIQQNRLQARRIEQRAHIERAQQTLQATNQAVAQVEAEQSSAAENLQAALQKQDSAEKVRSQADAAYQMQIKRIAEVESANQRIVEQRTNLAAEITRVKAQLGVLAQAEAALSGYSSGTRLLLQATRQKKLTGVINALNVVLDVNAEHEAAISAALGEFLDATLFTIDSEKVIEFLQERVRSDFSSGKGALLPLGEMKQVAGLLPDPDYLVELGADWIGVASELVRVPGEIRPTINLLLGRVWVVRNRHAARRLLKKYSDNRLASVSISELRVVTLEGEVFHASGPILIPAGSKGAKLESQAEYNTTLSRQRQIRELRATIAQHEIQLSQMDDQRLESEKRLEFMQTDLNRLAQVLRTTQEDFEQARLSVHQSHLQMEQVEMQARWQGEQRDRLHSEIAQGEEELVQASSEIERLEGEVAGLRNRLRETSHILVSLALEEHQAQVNYWNTQVAVSQRAVADAERRLQERRANFDRATQAQIKLEQRLSVLAEGLTDLAQQIATWQETEATVGKQIEELRMILSPVEAQLEQVEQEQRELQSTTTASRQTLNLADQRYTQARINFNRRQDALQALRRRIEDDFGLVAFEYAEQVSGPTPLPLEGMVEQLPHLLQLPGEVEDTIKRLRAQLRRIGAINPEAQAEYQEVKQRYGFLKEQVADLHQAESDVRQVITELDGLMEREFRRTFEAVAGKFHEIFTRLFGGGSAKLILTDPDDLTETGIDIEARLPGRRTQGLSLLSGGERSLTAAALIFALLKVSPTPFCVLDEVDAMLDEANVARFRDMLNELSINTQIIVVTHNRGTVQAADVIYGVTMGSDSVSQVLSLRMDELSRVVD